MPKLKYFCVIFKSLKEIIIIIRIGSCGERGGVWERQQLETSGQFHAPTPFYSRGKSPRYPLNRRFGGPQSRFGRHGEEKILDPTGTRTPTPRSSSL
jgi:hypothetical protein